jgi:exosome complex exonuclease RRP6
VRKERVQETVKRIHGSLSIVPTAPSAPLRPSEKPISEEPTPEEVAGQIEIPFVPADERHETAAMATIETVKDTIIVVGQPQRKKRKREKKASRASTMTSPNAEAAAEVDDVEFDYTAVSNILDEGSDHEPDATLGSGRKRKQKQKKQGRR